MSERVAFARVLHGTHDVVATVARDYAAAATDGHFPDEPLLPGSALLDLMVLAARALSAEPRRLVGVERAVFRRRVGPYERIVVTARRHDDRDVDALVRANDDDAATARLRFELET